LGFVAVVSLFLCIQEFVSPPSKYTSLCGTFISVCDSHLGQLSLAIPSWAMSTSQRAMMPCSWGVKAGMVHVWVADKTV